ncbi:hypothetical protein [Frankia sp. KB5]|uniref:hypothetical protein n=1 Tax=Frankia sp. KB5 TaxID=683318 RepID=UPI000A1184F4|nr:hypothetical protein [Frankia sp. KB5]ORT46784.1 hypothetical protein KBI5_23335 [Frankia sp. KB5]
MPGFGLSRPPEPYPYDRDYLPAPQTRTQREVAAAADLEAGRGVIAGTRVEATAYVAHTGMAHVAALTAQEADLFKKYPHAAERFQVIVDSFAGTVVTEIARMNRSRGYER